MAKIFLSHSSADKTASDALRARLHSLGHDVFLDHHRDDGIQPGEDWEQALYERLRWADALVCLVTTSYIASRWCFAEVALARSSGRVIVPLNLELGVRHPLLGRAQGLDYASAPAEAIDRLAARLVTLDAAGGKAPNPERVYRGLDPLDTDDRAVFFGRERESEELAQTARARVTTSQPRAVIVVGASGSGKSSLLRAGLIPRLLDEHWWRLRPFRPDEKPLHALADAIARARKELGLPTEFARVSAALPGGLNELAREILREAPDDRQQLLICIDQMEELFTRTGEADCRVFVEMLSAAVTQNRGPVSMVGTLRSEFVGTLTRFPHAAALRERPFLLAPLRREQLEDVVVKPARAAGIMLDQDVARRLVDDTGSGEALALLAFTLERLTAGLTAGDRVDMARYEATGGVQSSVKNQAEAALAELARNGHDESEVMSTLIAFVTLEEGGQPTARRLSAAQLGARASAVVSAFVDARLLTTYTEGNVTLHGVVHETLFTAWPRLAGAIALAEQDLRFRRTLERTAADWQRDGRTAGLLWRGEHLERAQRLLAREGDTGTTPEREFVDASTRTARAALEREATILVDRVLGAGILKSDPELALLYCLAAVDEFATTPAAIAGLRLGLAEQRNIARVGPTEHPISNATISDDGSVLAIADSGTNVLVKPSTRPGPPPPAGEIQVSLWRVGDAAPFASTLLPGRSAEVMAFSRNRRNLAVCADDWLYLLDENLVERARFSVEPTLDKRSDPPSPLRNRSIWFEEGDLVTLRTPGEERIIVFAREANGDWRGARLEEVEHWLFEPHIRESKIAAPPRSSQLVEVHTAKRLLDISGREIRIYTEAPVDDYERVDGMTLESATWIGTPFGHPGGDFARLRSRIEGTDVLQPTLAAAALSGDERRLAYATRLELGVVDVATGEVIARFGVHDDEEGDVYSSVALNADGTLLASGSVGGGRSHVWEVASGRTSKQLGASVVAFSRRGAWLAVGHHWGIKAGLVDGTLTLFDPHNAAQLAFDLENTALLAVNRFETVEYLLPNGDVAARFAKTIGPTCFSDDGRLLGYPGYLVRWPDRSPDAVIARARKYVYRSLTAEERAKFELPPVPRDNPLPAS